MTTKRVKIKKKDLSALEKSFDKKCELVKQKYGHAIEAAAANLTSMVVDEIQSNPANPFPLPAIHSKQLSVKENSPAPRCSTGKPTTPHSPAEFFHNSG